MCELLAVQHGDLELDMFSNSVLHAIIEFYVLSLLNLFCAYISRTLYDIHHKQHGSAD